MIETPTLFILGAGASKPYGYPTGIELRRFICDNFPDIFTNLYRGEQEASDAASQKAKDFSSYFDKSNTPSIDLFLARNQDDAKFGKKAIVVSIMESEKSSNLNETHVQPSENWYFYLYSRMTDHMITPDSYNDFSKNKVSILTFNYDRSLDYYFENSLINSYHSKNQQEIRNQLSCMEIHHIYGYFDKIPSNGGRGYKSPYNLSDLERCSNNIRIVHEIGEEYQKAKEFIENAERIFILGFGYAPENMEAIGMPKAIKNGASIFGTGKGMTRREIQKIKDDFTHHFNENRIKIGRFVIEDMNCYQLLREYL